MSFSQGTAHKFDLGSLFGHTEPEKLIHFDDLGIASAFIRKYAFNFNKSLQRKKGGGGTHVKWLCSDHKAGCPWFVSLSRKRKSTIAEGTSKIQRKPPKTKLSHIPKSAWYISNMMLEHAQLCASVVPMTPEVMLEHPGFRGTILEGHCTSMARVVKNMRDVHGVDISRQSAMAYCNGPRVCSSLAYTFLLEFARRNPGSRVCCQLDSKGRFYRAFLSIGSVVWAQDAFLPVWECDGTHMKDPLYNGICLSIIGKDGNKQNVPVAVAYIHKETVDNFAWFFCNCIVAGMKMSFRPAFCGRGNQLAAQALLLRLGLKVHLKFCILYIRFNTMDKFKSLKLNLQSVKDDISALQAASTTEGYEHVKSAISAKYPKDISKVVGEKVVDEYIWSCLCSIHPTDWSVVGNIEATPHEAKWLSENWAGIRTHGDPLPLFGVRTTSAIEGENNGLLWGRVRNQLVLGSIMSYCLRVLTVMQKRKKQIKSWKKTNCGVTPHALKVFEKEKLLVAQQNVVQGSAQQFYVFDAFDSRSITDQVKPHPLYRQAGRSCMRPKEVSDFTRGTKRKPNWGECAGSSTRIMRPTAIKTVPYGCDDSDDETKAIAAYFNDQVKGARTIKRGDYPCSRCNQIGHNVRSCTTPLTEIEESGVGIVQGVT
ncbi:unnamed protein product [Phytophthora fragariaefolia]|uniref:Unnamed protein product n=1 Tax=Phytophthora fragariaefolia TaxID=1490495 RepID=A0A9W6YCT4_9STRA|nr:unnamed protein product [Phytophthora fragariaefolia]